LGPEKRGEEWKRNEKSGATLDFHAGLRAAGRARRAAGAGQFHGGGVVDDADVGADLEDVGRADRRVNERIGHCESARGRAFQDGL